MKSSLQQLEGMACALYAVLAHFRPFVCAVVTLIMFSSNLSTFEEISKTNPKISKNPKILKKLKFFEDKKS